MADFSFELACTRVPKFPREQAIQLAEMRIDKLNPTSYIQIVESPVSVCCRRRELRFGGMVYARPAIRYFKPGRSASLRLYGTNAGGLHGIFHQGGGASPDRLFSSASKKGRPRNPSPSTRPAPNQQLEQFRLTGRGGSMRLTICPKCGTLSLVGYCGSGPDSLLYLVSLDRMGKTELSRLASLRAWSPVREVGKVRPQRPVVPRLPGLEESRAASDERIVPRNLAGGSPAAFAQLGRLPKCPGGWRGVSVSGGGSVGTGHHPAPLAVQWELRRRRTPPGRHHPSSAAVTDYKKGRGTYPSLIT